MRVDATRSRNESVSIDYDGARPNDEIDAIARIGIAGAATYLLFRPRPAG